jgi:hypothetical protein
VLEFAVDLSLEKQIGWGDQFSRIAPILETLLQPYLMQLVLIRMGHLQTTKAGLSK